MKLELIKCPSCNADLTVTDKTDIVECTYCGTSVKVRDTMIIKSATNIENLLVIGFLAIAQKNYAEAIEFMNRILENDINNAKAWLGKGICCINGSYGNEPKLLEGFNYLLKANELANNIGKKEILGNIITLSDDYLFNAIINENTTLEKILSKYRDNALNSLREIDYTEYDSYLTKSIEAENKALDISEKKSRDTQMSNFYKLSGKIFVPVVFIVFIISLFIASITGKNSQKLSETAFILSFFGIVFMVFVFLWIITQGNHKVRKSERQNKKQ